MTTQTTPQKLTRDTIEIPYRHVTAHFITAYGAFTGSTTVGRHFAAVCVELLRPHTLEIESKSSASAMEDANLGDMSARLIGSCMTSAV